MGYVKNKDSLHLSTRYKPVKAQGLILRRAAAERKREEEARGDNIFAAATATITRIFYPEKSFSASAFLFPSIIIRVQRKFRVFPFFAHVAANFLDSRHLRASFKYLPRERKMLFAMQTSNLFSL